MACSKCDKEPVMYAAYSGAHLCESHFCESVEKRVRRRIRTDGLLDDAATPSDPDTWVIGLSGGKDSIVLTSILHETFAEDPRVELICLSIHEGIEGYRDESLEACRQLVADLGVQHEVVTYKQEYDIQMDDVAVEDPLNMSPCAYCGVFRRDILERYATDLGADKLFTGHNLDDEAQTALMNILDGNVNQIAKHFDASLGRFRTNSNDPSTPRTRVLQDRFIPRAKPLRDIPEKEIALYCHLNGLPAHISECPHADEAFRGEIQQLLYRLEENHPGTRHSIMAGYEEIAGIIADTYRAERVADHTTPCSNCGTQTSQSICRRCSLLESLGVS